MNSVLVFDFLETRFYLRESPVRLSLFLKTSPDLPMKLSNQAKLLEKHIGITKNKFVDSKRKKYYYYKEVKEHAEYFRHDLCLNMKYNQHIVNNLIGG